MHKEGGPPSPLAPRACAGLGLALLTCCFSACVVVTRLSLLRCGGKAATSLGGHSHVTCTREDAGPPGSGGAWHCCPLGWARVGPGCLLPVGRNRTWAESAGGCSALGARLASLSTRAQLDSATQLLERGRVYFVGLRREERGLQWRWVDGTPFDPEAGSWHRPPPGPWREGRCGALASLDARWAWAPFPCRAPAASLCRLPGAAFRPQPPPPS